jgi:glycosyltransferase involved in cell wall biosynthesis
MDDSKIKVVHVVPDLGIGGTQKVVLNICSSADLNKYDITIFSLNNQLELLSENKLSEKINIIYSQYNYAQDFSLIGYFKRLNFNKYICTKNEAIIKQIISEKPDILHLHIIPIELNLGIIVAKATTCKLIFTDHLKRLEFKGLKNYLLGFALRKIYREYNLIAVSSGIYDLIVYHKLVGKYKNIALIENKLNLNHFVPCVNYYVDELNVIYVARLAHPKGHKELIEAWSVISKNNLDARLLLAGPDDFNGQLQLNAKQFGVENTIHFMGPQSNILSVLEKCHIGVFPSFKEGLPIALLEKMAMALPVLVSDISELTSIVTHNENGLVFKCGDVNDLAEKLHLLLNDGNLRKRLGKNARLTIEKKFGSNNIALPNELFYEKILHSN